MITHEIQITKEDKKSPFYREGFEKGFIDNEERFIYLLWLLKSSYRRGTIPSVSLFEGKK